MGHLKLVAKRPEDGLQRVDAALKQHVRFRIPPASRLIYEGFVPSKIIVPLGDVDLVILGHPDMLSTRADMDSFLVQGELTLLCEAGSCTKVSTATLKLETTGRHPMSELIISPLRDGFILKPNEQGSLRRTSRFVLKVLVI